MTWKEQDNMLTKEFTFKNFAQALAFVNRVGDVAQQQDHHPDILLHDYKCVRITTTTHSAGSTITDKDWEIAKSIDGVEA